MTDKIPQFNPETAPPSLTIDWDVYLPFFEDDDISEEDKYELIEALWSIVVSFVDLGFGVHPTQRVCGQDVSLTDLPAVDVVELCSTPHQQEEHVPGRSLGAGEGSPHE